MTLALANIPDEPAHLPGWLEGQLVGDTLRPLVAELVAIHDALPPDDSVREQLDDYLRPVKDCGLSALPHDKLQLLLRQPYYLLELQEIVLVEGGKYWQSLRRPAELIERTRAGKAAVEDLLFGPTAEPLVESEEQQASRPRSFRRFLAIAATAAVVAVATFAGTRLFGPQTTREASSSWAKVESLPRDLSGRQYLNRLAEHADELLEKASEKRSATEVAKLILAYRQGCSSLILNDHPQLTATERVWLKKHCLKWSQEFDEELRRLEETGDAGAALAATEATVRRLSNALRERAGSA